MKKKESRNKAIVEFLHKYNEEVHMKGETLPDAQQVFRVEVVKSILEENNYSLADQRGMRV